MAEISAQISVKGLLPVPDKAAVWLVHYGRENRYGLPGGRLTEADNGDMPAALVREVREEIDAEIDSDSLSLAGVRLNMHDPRIDGEHRLVVVYAADLLQAPSGGVSAQGERAVAMPLAHLATIDLAPDYKQIIFDHMRFQGWPV